MRFVRIPVFVLAAACLAGLLLPAAAQLRPQLVESYVARLGQADHYNSKGQRLSHVWQIIRQDRANYHRFGIRDPEDQSDGFFGSSQNRAALENMLLGDALDTLVQRGQKYSEANFEARILNATPLIKVDIYQDQADGQTYVVLTIL